MTQTFKALRFIGSSPQDSFPWVRVLPGPKNQLLPIKAPVCLTTDYSLEDLTHIYPSLRKQLEGCELVTLTLNID